MNRRITFAHRTPRFRFYGAQRPKPHTYHPTLESPRWHPMYNRARARRHTRFSFVVSLLLHLTAVLLVSINLPHWYRPPPPTEPIVAEPIKVEVYSQRLYPTNVKKPIAHVNVPAQPRAHRAPSTSRLPSRTSVVEVDRASQPVRVASNPLHTEAQLPPAPDALFVEASENGQRLQESLGEPVETLAESPQSLTIEVGRGLSQKQEAEEQEPQTDDDEAQPLDRDAQIASVLETIAGDIASGEGSPVVDIVFLLDASGSMEDNIHAVGRHLINMVEVFQEAQLDFTLGVATFKYSALIFPQTKDYRKHERLLENVKCGGDERAYNAIVKSIERVKFRPAARRRFILVTDARCKGSYTMQEVLKRCWDAKITVDVIGGVTDLDVIEGAADTGDRLKAEREQKALARKTGGLWIPIPED